MKINFNRQNGQQIVIQQSPRLNNIATSSIVHSQIAQKLEVSEQPAIPQSNVMVTDFTSSLDVMPAKIPR